MKTKCYPASMHLPTPGEIREQKESGCRTPAQSDSSEPAPLLPEITPLEAPEPQNTVLPTAPA